MRSMRLYSFAEENELHIRTIPSIERMSGGTEQCGAQNAHVPLILAILPGVSRTHPIILALPVVTTQIL